MEKEALLTDSEFAELYKDFVVHLGDGDTPACGTYTKYGAITSPILRRVTCKHCRKK